MIIFSTKASEVISTSKAQGRGVARCAFVLAFAICANVLLNGGASAVIADLKMDGVHDPEVAHALLAAFNFPTIEASLSGDPASEEWNAAIETERNRLAALMAAFGYADARTDIIRTPLSAGATAESDAKKNLALETIGVELKPILGGRYRIGAIQIVGLGYPGLESLRDSLRDVVTPFVGMVARSDLLGQLDDKIRWNVRKTSRPFAKITVRDAIPNPEFHTTTIRIDLDPGPVAQFGAVTFHGLHRYKTNSVEDYVPFSLGDAYEPELVVSFGDTLRSIPRFRSVNVNEADAPDANGRVNVDVWLQEMPASHDALAQSRLSGMSILVCGLFVIAIRQTIVRSGGSTGSRNTLVLNGIIFCLLAVSSIFAIDRLISFINVG